MFYFFCSWKKKFAITDTKLYVLVVTLSTEGNIKLLKQLESGFKRTINWNKYQSKVTEQGQNRYFDYQLIQVFREQIDFLFHSFKINLIEM